MIYRHNPLQFTAIPFTYFWFLYVIITLETTALDTPNKVAFLVTDAPAKGAPTICHL